MNRVVSGLVIIRVLIDEFSNKTSDLSCSAGIEIITQLDETITFCAVDAYDQLAVFPFLLPMLVVFHYSTLLLEYIVYVDIQCIYKVYLSRERCQIY